MEPDNIKHILLLCNYSKIIRDLVKQLIQCIMIQHLSGTLLFVWNSMNVHYNETNSKWEVPDLGQQLHLSDIIIHNCFDHTVFWWNWNWFHLLVLTHCLLKAPVSHIRQQWLRWWLVAYGPKALPKTNGDIKLYILLIIVYHDPKLL